MDLALHHPRFGYYQTRREPVGRCGDFTTAPVVSALPARAIVHWARRVVRVAESPCRLIEVGGGDGSMAAAVLDALGWVGRRRVHLHIVESSASLVRLQQERLGRHARHVTWHSTISPALDECLHPIVFHNELVDAFPVVVLERRGGCWQEVCVACDGQGMLREVFRPMRPAVSERWQFSALDWQDAPNGQRVELHRSYFDWLLEWVPQCRALDLLTIDYGGTFPALYCRRPGGTLRSYFHHLGAGATAPLDYPGRQDITSDVNFTDLEAAGEVLGLEAVSRMPLAQFLAPAATRSLTPWDARLLDSSDAGGGYLVLHQRRRQVG